MMGYQAKKTIVSLLTAAVMTAAPVMGASPRYPEQPGTKNRVTMTAVGGQRMGKSLRSQKEDVNTPLTGVDEFVAKHLAMASLPREITYDPEKIPYITQKLEAASNYDKIPPHYKALIQANQDKWFWRSGVGMLYWGKEFKLQLYKNRVVVYHFKLDGGKMMATFEPVPTAKPFFTIPDNILKTFAPDERAYAESLRDVVNENVSFLFDVPFFVPNMDMFHRNEYGGKFIPEKYLITGDKLAEVPAELVDERKRDMQIRWGYPIYDVSQIETGKIDDPSGCFFDSEYRRMKVVDSLVLLNLDMVDHEVGSLWKIQSVQYKRAQKSLAVLQEAMANEAAYLKSQNQWTPNRAKVLTVLKRQLDKVIPPAYQLIENTLKKGEFIYTLRNPKGKPPLVRQPNVLLPAPTTSGHRKVNGER